MKLFIFIFSLLFSSSLFAQKRPVTISDFNNWNTIRNTTLTNNGKKLSYKLEPGKGNPQIVIYDIETAKNDTLQNADGLKINEEATIAAYKILPSLHQRRDAKKRELPKKKQPKDSLGIVLFNKNTVVKFPKLKTFKIPEDKGSWVAFTTEEKYLPPEDTTTTDSTRSSRSKLPKGGENLVIYNGLTTDTILLRNVTEFQWSKNGRILAYVVQKEDSVTLSDVRVFETETQKSRLVHNLEGYIKKLSIDDVGDQLAWLISEDTTKVKTWTLCYNMLSEDKIITIADSSGSALADNMVPSEHANLQFSESGKRLYFGSAPKPEQEPKDTLLDGEKVSVDIWSCNDLELQPRQKINLKRDKNRSYRAVYHIKENTIIQLATKELKNIRLDTKRDKQYALLNTEDPYLKASNWTGKFISDYYLIDITTGDKQLLVRGKNRIWKSPDEKYVVYYREADSNYCVINLKNQETTTLTKDFPTMLVDEENDLPMDPGPYGLAGWSKNGKHLYIYDRYDIWQLDPSGKDKPLNLTNGRVEKIRYRFIDLDRENDFINPSELQLLSVFNETTKDAGWANLDLKQNEGPKIKFLDAKGYSAPTKAKLADIMYYTRQDCNEFPDLWVASRDMMINKKVSDANPQKDAFIWNTVELVKWRSFNGDELEGLLYKPENFDPEKYYPVLVYFYERNSNNLNRFNSIYPSYSTINKTLYTSNGYLVFVPDIKYRIGHPGMSAYECIVSGVQNLIDTHSWIDAEHIGLQGQSWGGYQTAYLVTQTNMFAAGMAGAPVSNMTSAYGGIRWGSGLSRMFQYEHTQSRIGGSLWEKPLLYIENSPLFYANNVKTPLLIMHNDNDGAVPWYQGIEYFVALRRLDKPVWMLTYNNEPHNLKPSSWGNRMDLSTRMKQFFDHYLKGEKAPDWMLNGVKAVDKEYMKGF